MIIFRNILKYTIGLVWLIFVTIFGFCLALLSATMDFIIYGKSFITEFKDYCSLIIEDWKPIRR